MRFEKIKNILRKSFTLGEYTDEQLRKQNKDNYFIMNWLWLLFLIALAQTFFRGVPEIKKVFWIGASTLIFMIIHSLLNSIKQNNVILEIRKR